MDMVSIYRIENTEGKGPYCWSGYLTSEPDITSRSYESSPVPVEDGISMADFTDEHHFGFISARDLFRWFKGIEYGVVETMRNKDDWAIYLYHVPREQVLFGRRQVAFVKRSHVGVQRLT